MSYSKLHIFLLKTLHLGTQFIMETTHFREGGGGIIVR